MKKFIAVFAAFMLMMLSSFALAKKVVPAFAATEEKAIYLTFDDGPSDRVTPKILDVLKKKDVKATFFVIGNHILTRGNIINRIIDEGHSIGIHSYCHEYGKIYASETALLADVERCSDILKAFDVYTLLYRFPGGGNFAGEKYKRTIKEAGYTAVEWNAVCGDCEGCVTVNQIYKRAISFADAPSPVIMLTHDSTDKICVAEALPYIIDFYKEKGFVFKKFDMQPS